MPQIIKTTGQNGAIFTVKELATIHIKPGQRVRLERWIPPISDDQREMLFSYYRYCIDHGMRDLGHYSVDGVHEDVKAWCNEVHPGDFGGRISITRMNRTTFDLFWKTIDLEYFQLLAGVDTSDFWADYQTWKDSGTEIPFRQWKENL